MRATTIQNARSLIGSAKSLSNRGAMGYQESFHSEALLASNVKLHGVTFPSIEEILDDMMLTPVARSFVASTFPLTPEQEGRFFEEGFLAWERERLIDELAGGSLHQDDPEWEHVQILREYAGKNYPHYAGRMGGWIVHMDGGTLRGLIDELENAVLDYDEYMSRTTEAMGIGYNSIIANADDLAERHSTHARELQAVYDALCWADHVCDKTIGNLPRRWREYIVDKAEEVIVNLRPADLAYANF